MPNAFCILHERINEYIHQDRPNKQMQAYTNALSV